jgi:integrase
VTQPPVEYAVAVDHYLETLRLSDESRRVYRIALATWAWCLVDDAPPEGRQRRGAVPPMVPISLLDWEDAGRRLRTAVARRLITADARTVGREMSILRGAISFWRRRGWIHSDPLHGIRPPSTPPPESSELSPDQVKALFALPSALREQTCWRLLYESAAPIERVLALNIDDLDPIRRRARKDPGIRWRGGASRLLPLLLAGRVEGPVFLTRRRATPRMPPRDRCPITGRGRLSYRQAADLFAQATRPLDPEGRGWTLRRLRAAGQAAAPHLVR